MPKGLFLLLLSGFPGGGLKNSGAGHKIKAARI